MGGFDPSKFVAGEKPPPDRDVDPEGLWKDESVATVASVAATESSAPHPAQTAENKDVWDEPARSVASVAAVAVLPLDKPFAAQLNDMFHYPRPPWIRPSHWSKFCADARKFSDAGKCAEALAAGWEAIELFGVPVEPWRRMMGATGLVASLNGRGVGRVEPHAIEIINRIGARSRLYRAFAAERRANARLMWEAFHPSNMPPPEGYRVRDGRIMDISISPFGLARKL